MRGANKGKDVSGARRELSVNEKQANSCLPITQMGPGAT